MVGIWYATVEQVMDSLEVTTRARAIKLVRQKLESASRSVERQLNRRFYPERRIVKSDWPNSSYAPPWALDMWDNEFAVLYTVTAGGVDIPIENCIPRRGDDKLEPPYNRLEINLGSANSAFSAGLTFQQAVEIEALYTGDADTSTALGGAQVASNITGSDILLPILPLNGLQNIGIGSLLKIGSERLLVADRRMVDTTVNTSGALAANKSVTTVPVTDGTACVLGEVILVDSERMRIDDIAGNNLTVTRAWDGSVLAAHNTAADVWAFRTYVVYRGVLGSTASTHTTAEPIYVHEYPGLVNELCIAETVVGLENAAGAYSREQGSGENRRPSPGKALEDIRAQAYSAYGRKARQGSV